MFECQISRFKAKKPEFDEEVDTVLEETAKMRKT